MEYCQLYNIFVTLVTIDAFGHVKAAMTATECAGRTFSLTCGSKDYVVHVLYESYSYNPDQNTQTRCLYNSSECSGAQFINPFSSRYCNGYSQCSFVVPAGHTLSTCNENATAITVFYDCISKHQIIDVCSPYSASNRQQFYLKSPNYPDNKLPPARCRCNITGQYISAELYEHQKSMNGSVVFMFVTNKATLHVNDLQIRNKILFTEMNQVQMILDNRYQTELFRLWIMMNGNDMTVSCMSPTVMMPSSTTLIEEISRFQTVIPTSTLSVQIKTTFIEPPFTDMQPIKTENILESIQTSFLFTKEFFQSEIFSFQTLTVSSTKSTNHITQNSIISFDVSKSSSVIHSSTVELNPGSSNGQTQQYSDVDVRFIVVTVCVFTLILVISLALGIFIYRKNHRQQGFRTNTDDHEEIYNAYNFSFHNTYDKK